LAATPVSLSFTVSRASLTVTANNASRLYGASNPVFSDVITGFVNGDTTAVVTGAASLTTTATAASAVGGYAITASGTLAASNYTFTFVAGTLTVGKAPLTVAANGTSRLYGASNPAFSDVITGFVNGDTIAGVTGAASLTTTATAASAVGSYAVTAAGGTLSASSNYTFTFVNGTLTVTAAPLTVTVNNASRLYGAANPAFSGTISGLLNGDTVTATYSSTAMTTSVVGPYAITAVLSGAAANYSATITPGTLTLTAAALRVVANNIEVAFGLPIPVLDGTLTGVVAGEGITATYSTAAIQGSPAGNYPIIATLQDPNNRLSNYSVTNIPGTLSIPVSLSTVVQFNGPGSVLPITGETLNGPSSSAVDGTGNVYVADTGNNRIVKVSPTGAASELVSATTTVNAKTLNNPTGIASDVAGNVFVADFYNNRIVTVTAAGALGVLNTGSLTLTNPYGVAVNSTGVVYIADQYANRIVQVQAGGVASVVATPGYRLVLPSAVAVDPSGALYIADSGDNRVLKVVLATATTPGTASVLSTGSFTLNNPTIAVDGSGNLYIADTGNNRVVAVPVKGVPSVLNTGSLTLKGPGGVAVDQLGSVYITDSGNNHMVEFQESWVNLVRPIRGATAAPPQA
jgi:sugar lactone lactonase YvrE